ncbi:MAG: VWA domain-containing protein, partial [Ilumatobacteraceae bacterium]|nr:VWA domain-containing protein [Ilumatobacteraceae bacterium]
MGSVGKRGRTWTALCMALGLVAGLLVSVAIAVDDDSGDAQAASPVSDDFTGNPGGTNPYNGGVDWPDASTWVEANDGAGQPWSTGQIQATAAPGLLFGATGNGLGANTTITRDVDLSGFNPSLPPGATGAKVSFTLLARDDNDDLQLRFLDAADNPTVIADFGGSPVETRLSYVIPNSLLIADGAIQFGAGNGDWNNDTIEIGDLTIENAVANPDLPATCGVDVQVVLDESGSIYEFSNGGARGEIGVRDGVIAFLDGLNGTGSRINTHEFSNNGRDVELDPDESGIFETGYFPINDATIEAFLDDSGTPVTGYFKEVGTDAASVDSTDPETYEPRNADAGQDGESFTNWEAGLQKAVDVGADLAPVVIFFTDGVPNTVGTAGSSDNGNGDGAANSAAAAVGQIDAIKAAGAKVIAVGVGQVTEPANLERLAEFVEPTETPEIWDGNTKLDLSTVDVISVTDFSGLESALAEAAANFCSQQLVIDKVDENGAPIAGVDFETTVTGRPIPPGNDFFTFLEPAGGPSSASAATDGAGRAAFEWTADRSQVSAPTWTSSATFVETIPVGFTVNPGNPGTCTVVPSRGTEPALSVVVNNSEATYQLDGGAFEFMAGDLVSCEIRNEKVKPSVTVEKTVTSDPAPTGTENQFSVTYQVVVTNQGPGDTTYTLTDVTDFD